jgi:sugar phosphate isomerase/epimerase
MKYTWPAMNRRTFVQTSIAATLAAAHPSWARAARKIERVGLQLYTVRELMKSDFEGTIAKVAQIGYKEVEFAGYCGKTPQEVRAILDKNGLAAPSTHVGYDIVENKWEETLDTAKAIGHSFVVCPWIDEKQRVTPDGWKRAAQLFNQAGEAAQKAGIQFAYHNHSFEFEPSESLGNKLAYDFLLAETDPKLVKMEMDLCWITVAGSDPLKYFGKYPGRFPLVHVKDWTKKGPSGGNYDGATGTHAAQGHMADVGQGDINWKRIFAQSDKAGIQHYIVENDYPKSPDEDLRTSYDYLAKLTF